MPTYSYRCGVCEEGPISITKPMEAAGFAEPCPVCRKPMSRIWTPVASNVKGGTPIHHDRAWVRGHGGQGNSTRRGE